EAVSSTARSDLYALGGTLHFLLTGRPPFEGEGYALVKQHATARPRAPGERVAGIPPAVDALVLRLLAKEPEARGAGAAEVERELAELEAAGPVSGAGVAAALGAALVV